MIPSGGIILWYGETAPAGWQICNGSNGSPDLRDKVIVGASSFTLLPLADPYALATPANETDLPIGTEAEAATLKACFYIMKL